MVKSVKRRSMQRVDMSWVSLVCLLMLMVPGLAAAQSLGGAFNREDTPLLPANGNWWSPETGPGRWGLQIEAQTGSVFPQGFLGAAVFSYRSNDPSIPTWYSIARPYEYNPNWRQDGFIGDMEITLNQSTNGTCLLCPDGTNSGSPATPDVSNARLVFRDSVNAELIVGNVVHPIVKSHFGDGPKGHLDEFWRQTFRFNVEAEFLNTRINGFGNVRAVQANDPVSYEGLDDWDAFSFMMFVIAETVSSGRQDSVQQLFQILSHKETNQYRLIYPSLQATPRLEFKLFPQSRFVVEGRLINRVGFDDSAAVLGNVLFITVPSLQPDSNGDERPWY